MTRSQFIARSIIANGHISRRGFLRMLATGAGGALLVACGGPALPQSSDLQDAQPASTATGAPVAAVATAPAPTRAPTVQAAAANTITLWCYNNELSAVAQSFAQTTPGVTVDIKSYWSDGSYFERLSKALRDGKGAPDLAVANQYQLPALAASGSLADLAAAPFDGGKLAKGMAPVAWQAAFVNGKLLALPWSVNSAVLIYRADLLKAAGITGDPDKLAVQAQTWEAFLAIGEALKQKQAAAALVDDATSLFRMVTEQQGVGWFDGNRVLIRQKALKAAHLAAKARKLGIDGMRWSLDNPTLAFKQGTIAGMVGWSGVEHYLNGIVPETAGSWRAIPMPEGPVVWGSDFLVLPQQSQKHELAWKFAQYLCATISGQNAAFKAVGSFPAYRPAWADALYDQPVDFFGGQRVYRDIVQTVERAPVVTLGEYDLVADEAVSYELGQMLYAGTDPEQAMANAERTVLEKVPGAIAG